jgi:hypothetical protein
VDVIKSLQKTDMLKNAGIPEYFLGGNVELLGEGWKNQGQGQALSGKTYTQSFIPKFSRLFWQGISPDEESNK